jgi:hypothetical protein
LEVAVDLSDRILNDDDRLISAGLVYVYRTLYKYGTHKSFCHEQKSGKKWWMHKGLKPLSVVKL